MRLNAAVFVGMLVWISVIAVNVVGTTIDSYPAISRQAEPGCCSPLS
jgi:hypothetical protein